MGLSKVLKIWWFWIYLTSDIFTTPCVNFLVPTKRRKEEKEHSIKQESDVGLKLLEACKVYIYVLLLFYNNSSDLF